MRMQDFDDGDITVGVFRDELIDERTYVICGHGEAVIIDPHVDEDILSYLNDISRVYILLTHEHYDHISGVNWLRDNYACCVYASSICASNVQKVDNGTSRFPLLFICDKEKYHHVKDSIEVPYVCRVDEIVEEQLELELSGHHVFLWITRGHSPGGMSVLINDRYLFSGDNLLGNGMELKSIDADLDLYKKTVDEYCGLMNRKMIVFPGHGEIDGLDDYVFRVKEYYKWN